MSVTILGAQGSGKTWLARALALERPDLPIVDAVPTAPLEAADCVLLMGLDLPSAQASGEPDAELRAALAKAGIAFQVVYGTGPVRLQNAIDSIAANARSTRAKQQNVDAERQGMGSVCHAGGNLPGPQWHWQCERCSDPNCERRLFSSLTAQRATEAAAVRPEG